MSYLSDVPTVDIPAAIAKLAPPPPSSVTDTGLYIPNTFTVKLPSYGPTQLSTNQKLLIGAALAAFFLLGKH